MWNKLGTKSIATGCLLLGLGAGASGMAVAQGLFRSLFLNSGLFSVLEREEAIFSVSLDDRRGGPPARVRLQFLDVNGAVVAEDDTVIEAGESATLVAPGPGPLRAHAEAFESNLPLSTRREFSGSVEVFDLTTGKPRPTCKFNPDGLGPGR